MSNDTTPAATGNPGGYLGGPGGFAAWFSSVDHKRIALMFLGWTMVALLMGAIFGILLIARSLGGRGMDPRFIFETLTYHRMLLVFMFLIPAIPSTLGFFLLPLHLGTSNMIYPAMARCSLRFYVTGLVLLLVSLVMAPVGTGWTMDVPLSLTDPGAFGVLAVGLIFMGLSWFLTGLNIIVTVHHRRAVDMGFFDMSILAWSLYLSAYLLVASGLIFAIIMFYLWGSRVFGGGGLFGLDSDPLLWKNYFWFVTTPAAFFALIPAVGVITEVISGLARKAVAGYRMMVGALIALMALGCITWGMNLAGQGQAPGTSMIFAAFGSLIVVPAALILYSWLATLYGGAVSDAVPGLFVVAFILHAGIATMMSLFLASPVVGSYLGTTMFTSTLLDYLVWGGALSALFAGLHFWWTKLVGLEYQEGVARLGGILYLVGINLALIPRMMMGSQGVGADMLVFVPGPTVLGELSALGWLIMFSGFGVIVSNLFATAWGKRTDTADPWGATTLEWTVGSPPPPGNFEEPVGD